MAMHEFTNVTGYVEVAMTGNLVGFIQGDFTFEVETGEYVTQGSDTIVAHTRGMRRCTGHLQRAWGMQSDDLYDWLAGDAEYDVKFYPLTGSAKTYTASGCVLTNLRGSITAAGADVLLIDCDFKALSWGAGDSGV